MNQAGLGLLAVAALASLAGLFFSLGGEIRRSPPWKRAGQVSVHVVLGAVATATAVLLAALLSHQFGNLYVYQHTSRALPVVYAISALWAGNAGSLLLWLLLLAAFTAVTCEVARRRDPRSAAVVTATLSAMTLFFSLVLLFGSDCDPFAANRMTPTPTDGLGLNPQLQNAGMIIHPFTLLVGYVAAAVPFALLLGGLATKSPQDRWIGAVRSWALMVWLFLTLGDVVGAWWSYMTMGWGGYWAWDPVENASLIPWLTATALLHATSIAQRRGRHRYWMAWLTVLTFLLTVLGTFLTRSGVAQSIHAFANTGLAPWFAVFMAVMFVLAIVVIVWRRRLLDSGVSRASPIDERATFVYTNVVLSILAFLILWGVVFPPISNSLASRQIELNSNFFNMVTAPLGLVILALLVLCVLIRVDRDDRHRLGLDAATVVGTGIVVMVVLLAMGARKGYPAAAFTLSAMTIATMAIATIRTGLSWKRRRSYGTILIHVGLAILIVGLAGSWAYKISGEGRLGTNRSLTLGEVTVSLRQMQISRQPDREILSAVLDVTSDGRPAGQLVPSLEYYPAGGETWPRVARRTSITGDIYVTLLAADLSARSVSIRLEKHPLIVWLWTGGGLMAAGGLLALTLNRARSSKKRS